LQKRPNPVYKVHPNFNSQPHTITPVRRQEEFFIHEFVKKINRDSADIPLQSVAVESFIKKI
jgi:hypothetical protein